ncbi:hypothetical protein BCR36DRAFT_332778 [Piromyces finnis]|uniref:Uncharacterized protein n=1 Tax=Piromyces finnis TaxID=1754191 RepID=A0A1Y1V4L4_9FUNG|nr:hypothetical protein BCR36DRAFT_332778 [Piromyces finnis]|eukprot:ORX45788.1 hypothetical protein BCR36DRAFT_332778 [Piromyces finnis]
MNRNQHPFNYVQLQQQVNVLKSVEAATTHGVPLNSSKKRKSTSPPPFISSFKKQKQPTEEEARKNPHVQNCNVQTPVSLPSYQDIQKLYQALLLSKYQQISPDLLKVPKVQETVVTTTPIERHPEPNTLPKVSSSPEKIASTPHSTLDIEALVAQCNAHVIEGDISVIVKDLFDISKQKYNPELKLDYDQLKDYDLLQIFQKVFMDATNVPYNTSLNIIKYTLYVKLKKLKDIPGIQLVSVCDIIGKYNKKLLIHGILSPLLVEENFEKFQAQLIIKIFKEIKFSSEEYTLLLKNFATEKYQIINQKGTLNDDDFSSITLNDHHLTVLQTILNQKISMTNDMLKEIISVYNLFNIADIKKLKNHGMYLFSLCRACSKIKISNENYQELIRLSDLNETFLKKKIKDLLKNFKV